MAKKWQKLAKSIIYLRNGYHNRIQRPKIAYGRHISQKYLPDRQAQLNGTNALVLEYR